jgi:AraC-like DNA-binding protein
VYRWSTGQVDARDRFDHWREVRARGLFGVTAELEPERRPQFFGEFSLRKIGTAGLIELRASPYQVERGATDIANAPGDSLCIYQQLGGGGWFGVNGSSGFTVHGGSFATSHSDLPYSTVPLAADCFHLRILKVPAADILPSRIGLHALVPKPYGDHPSLAPLLESCFCDLTEADGDGDTAATVAVVQALAQFALIERGVVRPTSRAALGAIRVGRLSLARRLIARHLSRAGLSPAFMAELLGISVRHLYALFESTGVSFAQTVTAQRIEESRRLLKEAPQRSISQIAFACGFDSLATFYRAFLAAHGMSPGDFRAQASSTD